MLPPAPSGEVLVSMPQLAWSIWADGEAKVTDVALTIDGKSVKAVYNEDRQTVVYQPEQPLSFGIHDAICEIKINGKFPVKRQWQFSVLPQALAVLPPPDDLQKLAVQTVNRFRDEAGLEPMVDHPGLHHASKRHALYMQLNAATTHLQEKGRPGYFGPDGGERSMMFGFSELTAEVVSRSNQGLVGGIRQLYDAPYHRLFFLRPGRLNVGAGSAGPYTCLTFGGRPQGGIVTSPPDQATGVSTAWDGNEQPDPLRASGLKAPVGYPITFTIFSRQTGKITFKKAELFDELDRSVKVFVNHPQNDTELKDSLIIIPHAPLRPMTRYRVEVEVVSVTGVPVERAWAFTTGA